MHQNDNLVKILFRYYSNVFEQETVETMWAEILDAEKGYYKLDNIPFYGPPVSSDDIVFAEYDEAEKMLTYRNTVEHSGNSTIQVVLLNKAENIETIRDIFKVMGCVSEKVSEGYFAMDIPAKRDYKPIKQKLAELENDETIGFAEPWLTEKHRNEQ